MNVFGLPPPAASWLQCGSAALLCLAVAGTASDAGGADDPGFARGFYAGGGVGASRLDPESPIAGLRADEEHDTGFHLSLGYDFSRWLSAEIHLADLGAAGIDRRLAGEAGETTFDTDFDTIEYRTADIALLLYLFDTRTGVLPGRDDANAGGRGALSLYTRLGAGAMFNDAERDRVRHERVEGAHLSAGLGLEYVFGRGFAARAEYIAFDTDAHYASLGVIKRFARGSAPAPPVAPKPLPAPRPITQTPAPALPVALAATEGRFAFDSTALSAETREELDRFATLTRGGYGGLIVEGHTDSIGPAAYNETLGLGRARAARDYLIGLGIAAVRLRIESFGEQRPTATNDTAEGRALNRRVELRER